MLIHEPPFLLYGWGDPSYNYVQVATRYSRNWRVKARGKSVYSTLSQRESYHSLLTPALPSLQSKHRALLGWRMPFILLEYIYHGVFQNRQVLRVVGRKRPRSFCQKCRWQVTAKYACTLRMWLCMKWHGAWFRDGSSFMWHQPCQRCKYTTSVYIQKRAWKSYSLM